MYKVIIAEDELFVRLGIKMSVEWEKIGMTVVADVENGQQALQAWEIWKPDIIITDIKMPLMDGVSLIREIRKQDERTRFIILSCLEEFEIVREAISMGVTDYVLKLTMTQADMEKVLLKSKKELEILDGSGGEKQLPRDKKKFEKELRSWLYYRLDMSPKSRRVIEEQFQDMQDSRVRMILLEIDRYQECKKSFDDAYGTILDSAAENILSELLEGQTHILLVEKEGRSILILKEGSDGEELPADTEKLLETIRKVFGRYLGSTVTFALSLPGAGYEDLGILFRQCSLLMEKKFFYGTNRNLYFRGNLKRLGTEMLDIAHVTYLLYTNGFETLSRQEQGVARFLYLLSRPNQSNLLFPMQNRTWLKRLSYTDYSVADADMWSKRIRELTRWMSDEKDPGLPSFLGTVRGILQEPVQLLREAEMEFAARVDIYPVHVNDFVKTGFWPGSLRTSTIGPDHEIIQRRKEEYFGGLREQIISKLAFQTVEELAQKQMYYKDLLKLSELLKIEAGKEGSLECLMKSSLKKPEEGQAGGEIDKLIFEVCTQIRSRLDTCLSSLEEMWIKRQQERQRAQKELDVAGRYRGIRECFEKISGETSFKPLIGITPEFQRSICLIGSECYGKWYREQYAINEIDFAYHCPDIDPVDIAFLKLGDLLNLADDDAAKKLLRIL